MEKIHDLINETTGGDYIFFAGWRLDRDQQLLGEETSSRVDTVLTNAHARGVDLRVMLSDHPTQKNAPIHRHLKGLGVQCIRDGRHPRFGSAHQKFATICKAGALHAFCGGIDLAHRRRDYPTHPMGGWHDVQCYVRGPACRDLDVTFRERWNDSRRPGNWRVNHLPSNLLSHRHQMRDHITFKFSVPMPAITIIPSPQGVNSRHGGPVSRLSGWHGTTSTLRTSILCHTRSPMPWRWPC